MAEQTKAAGDELLSHLVKSLPRDIGIILERSVSVSAEQQAHDAIQLSDHRSTACTPHSDSAGPCQHVMQRSIRTSLGMLSDLPGDVQFAWDGAQEGGNFTFANGVQLGFLLAAVWNMPQLSQAPCGSLCHAAIVSVLKCPMLALKPNLTPPESRDAGVEHGVWCGLLAIFVRTVPDFAVSC
jgi:hypothetical protein